MLCGSGIELLLSTPPDRKVTFDVDKAMYGAPPGGCAASELILLLRSIRPAQACPYSSGGERHRQSALNLRSPTFGVLRSLCRAGFAKVAIIHDSIDMTSNLIDLG